MESTRLWFGRALTGCFAAALLAAIAAAQGRITAESDTTPRIQDRTYHFDAAGKDIPYSVYVPTAYDGSKPFPLIVVLHGLYSSSDQIIRYRGMTDLAEEHGYFLAAPMGYNNHGWYGSLGHGIPRIGQRAGNGDDPENLGELSEKDVLNVLGIVKKEFKIDDKRTFLMGHSMGGGGTYHIAITYPEIWAGLGPIAPAIYSSESQLETIKHIPIIVIQGDDDRLVNVEIARRWIAKMKELGITHKYIEIAGGDHVQVAPDNLPAIFAFFNEHSPQSSNP